MELSAKNTISLEAISFSRRQLRSPYVERKNLRQNLQQDYLFSYIIQYTVLNYLPTLRASKEQLISGGFRYCADHREVGSQFQNSRRTGTKDISKVCCNYCYFTHRLSVGDDVCIKWLDRLRLVQTKAFNSSPSLASKKPILMTSIIYL